MALEELVRGYHDVASDSQSGVRHRWCDPGLTQVEFRKFVGEAVDSMRSLAESKEIQLDYEAKAAIFARIFPAQMVVALQNLIENAIEATNTGSVTVTLISTGDHAVVEVRDHGCGIPEYMMGVLFAPFATFGKPGRLGVGLWAARIAVERLGGTIRACNTSSGALFSLVIPLDAAEAIRVQ
jgi:signal transduction histidine kinase